LKISVTGDFEPKKLAEQIDALFGVWPVCMTTPSKPIIELKNPGKTVKAEWNGAQSTVTLVQPGFRRQDKDWWAARILDFALGGGEFSSRLMEEVRVKRGLTYGVSSGLASLDLAPLWMVQANVDPTRVDMTVDLIKKTWDEVAKNGLTESERAEAQDYLIGSLPLALTSTDNIASILLQLQEDDLPKDTLDRRAEEIHAVSMDDIKRVARERLKADALTAIVVGPDKEQNHEPTHPVPGVDKASRAHSDIQ
jgi:zinc protease